jgi:hypothetical protein
MGAEAGIERARIVTPSNLRSSHVIPDNRCAVSRVPRRRLSIACGGMEGRRVVGEPTEANHDGDAIQSPSGHGLSSFCPSR